ncbi:MAG: hypothetical protein DRR16_12425 [Candidatus Parabeggiatoa sp. nov. 3]|nr:MAG: hypothetical protein DRR00_09035 [Gammaproteobacteria bacterium]RKZ66040.1 MAG: hypothetical protein DRQ99_10895 [Gammaproteobacteria bacterium]RKZ85276.1 MAG: hypothetical protein DRR16_12425 [Gammaproteobacteria bacterium]
MSEREASLPTILIKKFRAPKNWAFAKSIWNESRAYAKSIWNESRCKINLERKGAKSIWNENRAFKIYLDK